MKKIIATLLMVLMVIPAVSASVLSGSANYLLVMSDKTNDVQRISLIVMALSDASKGLEWDVSPEIERLAFLLIEHQNPDGGWGYHLSQASDVLDTSYAVIALVRAREHVSPDRVHLVNDAIYRGVSYLLSSRTGNAWGYVPETRPSFYPTVMSVWALGEYGFSYASPIIRDAVRFLNSTSPDIRPNEALALKVIAYHAVQLPIPKELVVQLEDVLYSGNVTMKERAMLTYALELVNPFDFNTARLLTQLESLASGGGNITYWYTQPEAMFSSYQTVETTAYALMALSIPAHHIGPITPPKNPYWLPCDVLMNLQNPDGGWPVKEGEPSNEMATYYALTTVGKCYWKNETLQRALNWTKERFLKDLNGTFTPGFYYTVRTLLDFGLLNDTERNEAISFVLNSHLKGYDYLWGNELGPQPYDTALAVRTLVDLGYPSNDTIIRRAVEWVLTHGDGGWGVIVTTRYYSYTLGPDVSMTIGILEALGGIAPNERLEPHAVWLASQRIGGGWAPFVKFYDPFEGRWYYGKPTVSLTVRATDVLADFGYNFTRETLEFVLSERDSGAINNWTMDTALAINYLSRFSFVPPVTLYEIETLLMHGNMSVVTVGLTQNESREIVDSLNDLFGGPFVLLNTSNTTEVPDNSIVVAPYGSFDVAKYNPHLTFVVENGTVRLGNYLVPEEGSIAIIPGSTANGMVLFVFYGRDSREMAVELFTTGFIKYLRGNAMLIVNENGRIVQYIVG